MHLSDFLNDEEGAMYKNFFRFDGKLMCNAEAPLITATKLGSLKFRNFEGLIEHLPAQMAINAIIEKAEMPNTTFANSHIYPAWEIDEILGTEMILNISLALLSVMVIVLIIMGNILISVLVLGCVFLTMIDVLGTLYFWGMTLDQFSLMSTIIGIGLSVDYSVHIAHAFITSEGTKMQKTTNGFITISPAILQGGFTTFLAIVFLCNSHSHSFITFFKVNTMNVLFGLFHGLFFLPVMLLLFGSNDEKRDSDEGNPPIKRGVSMSTLKGVDNPDFE